MDVEISVLTEATVEAAGVVVVIVVVTGAL